LSVYSPPIFEVEEAYEILLLSECPPPPFSLLGNMPSYVYISAPPAFVLYAARDVSKERRRLGLPRTSCPRT
jgi:hypothetical protein